MNRLITPDEFTAEVVRSMNKAEDEAGVPRGSIAKAWIEAFNKRADGADDESKTATSIAMSLQPTRGEALADRIERIGLVRFCHETGVEFRDAEKMIVLALRIASVQEAQATDSPPPP